ncbi:MAG: hypothetical protein A2138_09870 [Deltaproteobacteria bacterium RBG_16_71_12]|nr:MAG: hypothetical protein A2138_09870 [Deltaproteobacteria bacterium RBG_16_71_12]
MTVVAGTLAACLAPDVLSALEGALAPPLPLRAKGRFEVEIEAVGEGTFTLTVDAGAVSANKGFAKAPLVSALVGKGAFPFVQRLLQAALDGFPAAPRLAKGLAAGRAPRPGDLDLALAALTRIKDACLRFEVKGAGSYALARGPVDEATNVLTVVVDAKAVEGALAGAPLSTLKLELKGDRGVLTSVVAALGPVIERMR